ncbi:PREDICTED: uncharacterized protein LOC109209738 [Nicotiana attenuata]|uniref:uncharacterized protein LOC109209738 n=1 Tax=Nicotiana attenuata TaxID=49451 RepID=UPI0009047DA2|nr:PREDICTED: uncharacterized protein LOC109209738 [Nicotiana attenuata]
MAVCDWDMCFTFVWPGWEGTPHDARIFDQALRRQNLNFPHPPSGKYYLVDSGYPTDFKRNSSFRDPNEAFNFFTPVFDIHLVTTTMAIHNFIRRRSSTDKEFNYYANEDITAEIEEGYGPSGIPLEMQDKSTTIMEALRDRIRDETVEKYYHV